MDLVGDDDRVGGKVRAGIKQFGRREVQRSFILRERRTDDRVGIRGSGCA